MNILLVGGFGYVGCYLHEKLGKEQVDISVCDSGLRGNPPNIRAAFSDYSLMSKKQLKDFDAVLWFAGHSSVNAAMSDPNGAIMNNCLDLFAFAQRLPKSTKFIYASSASLYSSENYKGPVDEESFASIPSQNAYDISKFAFDYLAENFLENAIGLRMGTVSGFSPNLRRELVFNAMNLSAVRDKVVTVQNADCRRTILFLDDLWCLIKNLLQTSNCKKIYNAGSYSMTIGELATRIASIWGVDVVDRGITSTYSFEMNLQRMEELCEVRLREKSFAQQCEAFIQSCETGGLLHDRV